MRKYSLTKHFKIFVACTVTLTAALLFVTVQPAQAENELIRSSDAVSQAKAETETITDSPTSDKTSQRILDGDSTSDNGDILIIEDGVELIMNDNHAVKMTKKNNSVTNKGTIKVTGGVRRLRHIQPFTHSALTPPSSIAVR